MEAVMSDTFVRVKTFDMPNGKRHRYEIEASSLEISERLAYRAALQDGWEPPKLREKWWQVWRPERHTEILHEILQQQAKP